MAYTIVQVPDQVSAIYNQMVFRTIDLSLVQAGWTYNFYILDENGTEISIFKVFPDLIGYGRVDVSKVLKNYLTFDFNPTITTIISCPNSVLQYRVTQGFGPIDGAVVTSVTDQGSLLKLTLMDFTGSISIGEEVDELTLPGLTLSAAPPYYIRLVSGVYRVYSDALLTNPVTATGTFNPYGFMNITIGGLSTTFTDDSTYSNHYFAAINAIRSYSEHLDWNNASEFTFESPASPGLTKKFLTLAPRTKLVFDGEYETLSFLHLPRTLEDTSPVTQSNDYVDFIRYKFYNSTGSLLGTYDLNNTLFAIYDESLDTPKYTNVKNLRLDIPSGPLNLQTQLDLYPTTASYTIQAHKADEDLSPMSELFTYELEDFCSKYEKVRLTWLNSLGGIDYFSFTLKNKSEAIEKENYRKFLFFDYETSSRGEVPYKVEYQRSYTLISDWLSQDYSDWLKELPISPEVYILNEDGSLRPVVVTNESYSYKVQGGEKLIQLEITIMDSNKNSSNL